MATVKIIGCILGSFGIFYNFIVGLIFKTFYGKGQKVSHIEDKILLLDATTLAKQIRSRKLKSIDLVKKYIKRLKEVNPLINSLVKDRFDDAIKEAEEVDKILDSPAVPEEYSEKNKPFLGVPTSVKVAFKVTDMPCHSGLVAYKDRIATEDAECIKNLRNAGAIVLGVTNVSEMCMWYESSNNVCGQTKNPYDTSRIVGGSSGGEGATIAAGGAVIGVGSDIGGSIRMPSFFNGIFGHKPSRGVVSNVGQVPCADGDGLNYLSSGPMCRYAEDLIPLLKVLAGDTLLKSKLDLDQKVDVKKLKVYYMEEDGGSILVQSVQKDIKDAMRKVIKYLKEDLGMEVQKIELPNMEYSFEIWSNLMSVPVSKQTPFASIIGGDSGPVNPFVELLKWMVMQSEHTLPAISLALFEKLEGHDQEKNEKMLKMCNDLRNEFDSLLSDAAVFLYPPHPRVALYHNEPIMYPFNFPYTAIFNVLGLPVTACPLGLNEEGLPLGVQVVGAHLRDHLTIAMAQTLQDKFGGWVNP